jgi:hypothetical protein
MLPVTFANEEMKSKQYETIEWWLHLGSFIFRKILGFIHGAPR